VPSTAVNLGADIGAMGDAGDTAAGDAANAGTDLLNRNQIQRPPIQKGLLITVMLVLHRTKSGNPAFILDSRALYNRYVAINW
jgi:hypothetical protein